MNITNETMDLLRKSQELRKATNNQGFTTGAGLVAYSLEPQAKLLYPVLTPFRNILPRVGPVTGFTGTAERWKTLTNINQTQIFAGVQEGQRNKAVTYTEEDRIASYVGLGMEDFVSFEADYASLGFEDLKALAVLTGLQNLMVQEENIILNGNASLALLQANKPKGVAKATTGGLFPDGTTNYCYVCALTKRGFDIGASTATNGVAGGAQNPVPSAGVLTPTVARVNQDSTTANYGGGVSQVSAASDAFTTTGGGTSVVTLSVTPTEGAFGYAWFVGVTSGASNAQLVAISSLPTVDITGVATATYPASTTALGSDNSVNALEFDGLITNALKNSGYYKSLAGQTLTADGFGGVVEIDVALKYFWDAFKLSPTTIWCDSQTIRDIVKKVAAGTTNPAYRINVENGIGGLGNLTAGNLVTTYLNKYSIDGASAIAVKIHPNMPAGTIYFDMDRLPAGWGHAKVGTPRRIRTRREYYQIEWPLRTRNYEYGVYVDEMLQVYIGFGTGIITDIAQG